MRQNRRPITGATAAATVAQGTNLRGRVNSSRIRSATYLPGRERSPALPDTSRLESPVSLPVEPHHARYRLPVLYNQVLLGYIDSILQSQSGATTVKHGKHTAQDQTLDQSPK